MMIHDRPALRGVAASEEGAMMIHAVQHLPAFVDTVGGPQSADVADVEALLAVPWIAAWQRDDLESRGGILRGRPFHRWSVAADSLVPSDLVDLAALLAEPWVPGRWLLVAEYDGGASWWVVAWLTSDAPIPLPAWERPKDAV
jgi:hypothetical protein